MCPTIVMIPALRGPPALAPGVAPRRTQPRRCAPPAALGARPPPPEDSDRVQDALVDMIRLEVGKKKVEEYVEESAEGLRKVAEEVRRCSGGGGGSAGGQGLQPAKGGAGPALEALPPAAGSARPSASGLGNQQACPLLAAPCRPSRSLTGWRS